MKKILTVLILIPTLIWAADNQSLNQFMLKNIGWSQDNSNKVHVGTRCATVLDAAIWRLSSDNRDEVKGMIGAYQEVGDIYMYSTAALAEQINYSSEGYTKFYKTWMDSYKAMGEENHYKYNDFFNGMLGEDFQTCTRKETIEVYKALLEDMAKR